MSRLTKLVRSAFRVAKTTPESNRPALRLVDEDTDEACDKLKQLSAPERVLTALRNAAASGNMLDAHFRELVEAIFAFSEHNPERMATIGRSVIAQRQTDIILNLCRHIIANRKFLVFDIGANDGWFIERIFLEPRDIHVVAFEPLREMQSKLNEFALKFGNTEIVAKAVGAKFETAKLKACEQVTGLSSLLAYEPGYQYFHDGFQQEQGEEYDVEVMPLDFYYETAPALHSYENIALKIDTQGYEHHVLSGASKLLKSGRVKAVLIELVTRPKYASSATYEAIMETLHQQGFVVFDMLPFYREIKMQFQEAPHGRLTEFDCLFVHKSFLEQHPV